MNEATHAPRDFIVRTMNAEEVNLAIEWAAHEGWNPGFHDAHVFRAADPDGFFIGELQGEPVGSISAVAYDAHFGFIGLYIVRPEFRGKGLRLAHLAAWHCVSRQAQRWTRWRGRAATELQEVGI